MTGRLKYFKGLAQDPEYDQLLIKFTNGCHLAYEAPRKLGEITLVNDVETLLEAKRLGPDGLDSAFDLSAFKKVLAGRWAMVKSALMNQHILSGVGNVYSDEILFQTGLHPRTKVNQLSEETLETLFYTMKDVLRTAVDCQADPEQFPDTYLIPHRRGDGKCPKCGGEIERIKVSERSAYFCPSCQAEHPAFNKT